MSHNVTQIQAKLADLGYLSALAPDGTSNIDGKFGERSLDAYNHFRATLGKGPVVKADQVELEADLWPDEVPPPALPKPNPLDNPLVRLGLQFLISRIFPGKDFPVGTIITTIESAWASKINWTQVVGVVASVAVYFGIPIGDNEKLAIIGIIQGVQSLVTWYLKTYRTTTVTPASAAKIAGTQ